MFTMAPERCVLAATAPPASRIRVDGSPTASNRAVEERLAAAERELRVQFTRIALQAELDLISATLRRLPGGPLAARGETPCG